MCVLQSDSMSTGLSQRGDPLTPPLVRRTRLGEPGQDRGYSPHIKLPDFDNITGEIPRDIFGVAFGCKARAC